MPIPKTPTPLEARSFEMEANPDAIAGLQANETFLLTGVKGGALGKGGEILGFAKYQFDQGNYQRLFNEKDTATSTSSDLQRPMNGLRNAIADNNAELIPVKLAEAVAALKKALPKADRAGVDAYAADPQQVIQQMSTLSQTLLNRVAEISEVIDGGLKTIADTSGMLFPNGQSDQNDRGLLARTVASSQVDQLLGTNCVAEETFGMDVDGRVIGVSIQADGAGITGKFRAAEGQPKKDCLLDVKFDDPDIQRGLADLEAVDYLTGQIDRHCGNIFIDPKTKKVTGIDNDLAFPEYSREAMLSGGKGGKVVETMPTHMHEETAKKILALSPATLRQTLENMPVPATAGRLGAAAIDSACGRLEQLQNELKQPGGAIKVVANFGPETYQEAMAAQDAVVMARIGKSLSEANGDDSPKLESCAKTSYLGAATVQAKRYNLGEKESPNDYGVRPATEAGPAPRNAEAASFATQMEMTKKTLMNNPASLAQMGQGMQQAEAIHKEIGALKDKVAHYEKEQAGLQKNKIGSLVRSLASGGSAKRQEFYGEKKLEAMQQIGQLQRQLETIATNAISNEFKGDVRAFAQARAPQNQRAAVQPNPALAGMVPPHPAPPPPGQFNHAPPPDMAPAVPDQDNLAQGNDAPKAGKVNIAAKSKEGDLTFKAAEDEQDIHDLDDDDDDLGVNSEAEIEAEVKVEVKQESLKKSPSVAEMLKGANSAPALGGHRPEQAQGQDGPKPKTNTLRASGEWQAAKPSAPKLGGGHSASHP